MGGGDVSGVVRLGSRERFWNLRLYPCYFVVPANSEN